MSVSPSHTPAIILNTESEVAFESPETHQATSGCVCSETRHWDIGVLDGLGMWWLVLRATVCSKPQGCGYSLVLLFLQCVGQAGIAKGMYMGGEATSHIAA